MRSGFTLVEMLVCISLAIMLTSYALPALSTLQLKMTAQSMLTKVQRSVAFGRHSARLYATPVTVCPLKQGLCHDDWNQGFSIFIDADRVGALDSNDELLTRVAFSHPSDKAMYNRRWLRFDEFGQSFGSNGTLNYCPKGQKAFSKQLIVSNTGRTKIGHKSDRPCQ
ncbi:GspH/FimT family pseudopilin [Paraferrimonas haliotis]|uniref:Type II secretion system protein H n=1 Tax=Paraferrimonas haliotis TaxID=2013866 RepID=A0AA37WWM0_9GAMM|nr:GspH/FimT family pseudopilin [Paraferrimonas haliotis]GLS82564.1 type IV minor pilin protein FimT [Paraferrimonas haliotis]